MVRLLPVVLAATVSVPTAAQTCAGVLTLSFYDVDHEDRAAGRYVIPVHSLDVTAEYFHGEAAGQPTAVEARLDPSLTLEGKEALSRASRLYVPGNEVNVAPRCGLGLLHLEIEYWHETMTLDVYGVPSHVGLVLDEAVPFRPGRYVLDFDEIEEVDHRDQRRVYPASAVRPAD